MHVLVDRLSSMEWRAGYWKIGKEGWGNGILGGNLSAKLQSGGQSYFDFLKLKMLCSIAVLEAQTAQVLGCLLVHTSQVSTAWPC